MLNIKRLFVGGVIGAAALTAAPKAEAFTITLVVCQAAACTTVGPSGAAATTFSSGFTVGDYVIDSFGGSGFQSSTFSQSQAVELQARRVSDGSAAALDAWLVIQGYTLPAGSGFSLDPTLSASKGGTTSSLVSYMAWISLTNGTLGAGPTLPAGAISTPLLSCTPAPTGAPTTTGCSADAVPATVTASSALYSLISRTTINSATGDRSLYGSTGQVIVTAVPEPGSMLLLGTGLVGLASVIRRRLKK